MYVLKKCPIKFIGHFYLILPIVHFEYSIDFYPNPKGNIDEISSSSS